MGEVFATIEMQLAVAMVAQRYRLDLAPGFPVVLQPGLSLRTRHGLPMAVKALRKRELEAAA